MLYLVSPSTQQVRPWRPAMPIHPELGDLIVRASNPDEAYGRAIMRSVYTPPKAEAKAVTEVAQIPYQGNLAPRVTTKSELQKSAEAIVNLLQSALDGSGGKSKLCRIDREELAEAYCLADFLSTQLDEDHADSDER